MRGLGSRRSRLSVTALLGVAVAGFLAAAAQTASDTTPPSKPTGLTVQATSTSLKLNWTASTDNVGVVGYILYLDAQVDQRNKAHHVDLLWS